MRSRPPMFAAKVIRVLTRSAAAQELGPNVCWMLTVILGQEDSPAVRYSRPVTYYFEQLMPLCGFRSKKQLRAAITTAVETGWLEYSPGTKARPGRFRVKIPDGLADVEPYGCDESAPADNGQSDEKCGSDSEPNRDPKAKCGSDSEPEVHRMCTGSAPEVHRKGNPFLPIPIPSPKEEKAASGESPSASKNGKAKTPKFDPGAIEIPPPLQTDRFLAAWREWVTHRREIKRPLTPTATTQQIRRLAEWGESRSVAAIEHTVGNGWVGLREPDVSRNGTPPPSSSSVPDRRPVTLAELRAQGERP